MAPGSSYSRWAVAYLGDGSFPQFPVGGRERDMGRDPQLWAGRGGGIPSPYCSLQSDQLVSLST